MIGFPERPLCITRFHRRQGRPCWFLWCGRGRRCACFRKDGGAEAEAFQPAALAGEWAQFEALLGRDIPSTHAIIVLSRDAGELLNEGQRKDLWRAFRVPVFEQILAENGSLLAAECEAHDGLHVQSPDLAAEAGCAEGIALAPRAMRLRENGAKANARQPRSRADSFNRRMKKEKVPSDLQDSLFSGRHARSELGAQKRRDVCPQLPAAGFTQRRITALVRIRDSAFGGSSPLDTAFHSPAARACLADRTPQPGQRSRPISSRQF